VTARTCARVVPNPTSLSKGRYRIGRQDSAALGQRFLDGSRGQLDSRPRAFCRAVGLGVPPSPSEPIGAGQARAWSAFFLLARACSATGDPDQRKVCSDPGEHAAQERGGFAAQDGEAATQVRAGPELTNDGRGVPENILRRDHAADRHLPPPPRVLLPEPSCESCATLGQRPTWASSRER
jgi:hypothetical protein